MIVLSKERRWRMGNEKGEQRSVSCQGNFFEMLKRIMIME